MFQRVSAFLKNQALWILMTAVAIYWLADSAIGTEKTRDYADFGVMIGSGFLTLRLMPHAVDKFMLGGRQNDWRFLMGNVLFWGGIFAQRTWALAYRWSNRPDWMEESSWNGFFQFWILGAAILCITASTPSLDTVPQSRIFFTLAVGAGSFLAGVIVSRWAGWSFI